MQCFLKFLRCTSRGWLTKLIFFALSIIVHGMLALLIYYSYREKLVPKQQPLCVEIDLRPSTKANSSEGVIIEPVVKTAPTRDAPINKTRKSRKTLPQGNSDEMSGAGHRGDDDKTIEPVAEIRPLPVLITNDVEVPYPKKAKLLGIEGVVRLRLAVDRYGYVVDAKIISGPAFGLQDAALLVAKKLRFLPATDEYGRAKDAKIDHDVVFRLKEAL